MRRSTYLLLAIAMLLGALSQQILAVRATEADVAILPSERAGVTARTEDQASTYTFDVALDPDALTLSGSARVEYINTTGQPQRWLPFRLYPNADYYGTGDLRVSDVRVDGAAATPLFDASRTVMSVPLAGTLRPDAHTVIEFAFTTVVPVDSNGTYGVFSLDQARDSWILADWYPIVAGWEPGVGWFLDPPTPAGDPTFSQPGIYEIALTLPAGMDVAATGVEQRGDTVGGETRWSIVTGPVREFAMVLDDDFARYETDVHGTHITVYTNQDETLAAGATIALDAAAAALTTYGDAFGAYPYTELDLVDTELAGALGVSWTGLIFLNGPSMLANPFYTIEQPDRLRFTVTHEVAHQWWGVSVGMNSNDHVFLLEGLTNYLSIVVFERIDGAPVARQHLQAQCVDPYLGWLRQHGDGVADRPMDDPSGAPAGALIYGKAALGFLAIRDRIGDDAFFSALAAWANEYAFGLTEPKDLLAAFETASDQPVDDLWRIWFASAETTEADVQTLLAAAS